MNYIHLKHYHNKVSRFKHPLLDGCKSVSEEDLDKLAQEVLAGGPPDRLVLALRRALSLLVGRYLASWPDVEPYTDDIVSEGLIQIVRLCRDIPVDLFSERGILKIASSRAQLGIEMALNKLRCVASASHTQQWRRIENDEDPIYLVPETNHYKETIHPKDLGDEGMRDVIDAFCQLLPRDEIDDILLSEFNWGRSRRELSEDYGIPEETIRRRRQQLYEQYLELTR